MKMYLMMALLLSVTSLPAAFAASTDSESIFVLAKNDSWPSQGDKYKDEDEDHWPTEEEQKNPPAKNKDQTSNNGNPGGTKTPPPQNDNGDWPDKTPGNNAGNKNPWAGKNPDKPALPPAPVTPAPKVPAEPPAPQVPSEPPVAKTPAPKTPAEPPMAKPPRHKPPTRKSPPVRTVPPRVNPTEPPAPPVEGRPGGRSELPPVGNGHALLRGECHADDDSLFDWNAGIIGDVEGNSLPELYMACKRLTYDSPGGFVTYGVMNVRIIGPLPGHYRTATCFIDDDPNFDYDVYRIGEIAAASPRQLAEDCRFASHTIYREGSSGIKDLR